MRAIDVMMTDVATVRPETDVAEAVKLLVEHDASALPVVDTENRLVGILSEADLIERPLMRPQLITEAMVVRWSPALVRLDRCGWFNARLAQICDRAVRV